MRHSIFVLTAVVVFMAVGWQAQAQAQTQGVDQPGETSTNFQVLTQLAGDGDGHLAGVTATSEVYLWSGKEWSRIEGVLTQVSIGSPTDIWGVNKSNNSVWRTTPSGWQRMPGQMSYVGVAKGGGGVVAIDLNGQPYYWREPAWAPLPNTPTPLKQIEIGKPGNTYGIGLEDQIYKWMPAINNWKLMAGKLNKISVAPDGTVAGTNSNKQAWVASATSVDIEATGGSPATWVPQESNVGDVTIIAADTMILQNDQNIYIQKPIDTSTIAPPAIPGQSPTNPSQIIIDANIVVAPPEVLPPCSSLSGVDRQPGLTCDDTIQFVNTGISLYNPQACLVLSGTLTLKLPVPGTPTTSTAPTPTLMPRAVPVVDAPTCLRGTFHPVVTNANTSVAPLSVIHLPGFFALPTQTSSPTDLADSLTGTDQVMASVATQSQSAVGRPLPGLWSDYIGRPYSVVALNAPTDCQPTTFSDRSQYSWVEFRLPHGTTGQGIHIPPGSYNSAAYSAANRVWWGGMLFACNWPNAEPGWTKVSGDWGSDNSGDTSLPNPPSPYIAYGHR